VLERRQRLGRVFVSRIEQRLDGSMAGMACGQQPGRVLQVFVSKRHELEPAHAT
jgi:hypothetical protein